MGKNSDYATKADVEEIVERILARNNKVLLEDISEVINDLGFRMQEYIDEKTAPIPQIQKDIKVLKDDVSTLKVDVKVLKSDVEVLKSDVKVLKSDVEVLKSDVKVLKGDVKELKSDVRYLKATADNHTKRLFRLEAVDDRILDALKFDQKHLGQYS